MVCSSDIDPLSTGQESRHRRWHKSKMLTDVMNGVSIVLEDAEVHAR